MDNNYQEEENAIPSFEPSQEIADAVKQMIERL